MDMVEGNLPKVRKYDKCYMFSFLGGYGSADKRNCQWAGDVVGDMVKNSPVIVRLKFGRYFIMVKI